jgi:hypothetical protein
LDRTLVLSISVVLLATTGCQTSSSTPAGKATAPATQATTPASTPHTNVPPTPPTLVAAVWSGTGYHAAPGDRVTITFSQEVVVAGTADPSVELVLPVQGNTFGAGATMAAGLSPTDVVVTLGSFPVLRISGAFDAAATTSGSSTGIDVPATATGNILTPAGAAPATGPVDLGGSLTEGWTAVASLQVPRGEHTATLLRDGRILVVGGQAPIANVASTTPATIPYPVTDPEVYDPVANAFTKTTDPSLGGALGAMLVPVAGVATQTIAVGREQHTATLLADGRVLLAGGWGFERFDPRNPGQLLLEEVASCHVFDPSTNQFTETATPLTTARQRHGATLLPNGTVLIAGGLNSNVVWGTPPTPLNLSLASAEIYDPASNSIAPLSSSGLDMVNPRMDGVAAYDRTLDQVLFAGGAMRLPPTPPATPQSFFRVPGGAEEFTVSTGLFQNTASKPTEDLRYQATVTTAAGEIWILGGNDDMAKASSALVEVYTGGAFAPVGSLSQNRARAQADLLGDRLVVVAGGTKYNKAPGDECANVDLVDTQARAILPAPPMQNARNSFSLTTVGDRVFAIGGFNGSPGNPTSEDGVPVGVAEFYSRP